MTDQAPVEEIWVTTREAAQITGYSWQYVIRLAHKMTQQPAEERLIKVRRRNGHELWLPDLVSYIEGQGRGPYVKRTQNE